ncbi:glycosyltransferase [Alphaproteobacteria bacterium]|nr:glycosyltransferase [Alphaproteobacteria bacterium]
MKVLPKFSVVVSVYGGDRPDWVAESIESIFHQSVKPNEVILVVDGPIGCDLRRQVNILSKCKKIKVLETALNRGLGFSRHLAIMNTTNEIIAFMDSDDVSVYDRFERQLVEMSSKSVDVLGGLIEEFDESLKGESCIRLVPADEKQILGLAKWRSPMNHVTVMLRKKAYLASGGYVPMRANEDYDLFVRMMQCGCKFKNLQIILVKVRGGLGLLDRRGGLELLISDILIFRKMFKSGFLSAMHLIFNILLRVFIRFAPVWVRRFIYRRVLRT